MDGLNLGNSGLAGVVGISAVFVLPFTDGNVIVSFVVITAIICAVITLAVKVIKQLIVRG